MYLTFSLHVEKSNESGFFCGFFLVSSQEVIPRHCGLWLAQYASKSTSDFLQNCFVTKKKNRTLKAQSK